jgi:small-conductance mechanosensitive channel
MLPIDLHHLLSLALPLAWIAGGWLLGWLVEAALVGRLRKLAERTAWEGDDIAIDGLHGLVRLGGLLAGLHLAVGQWPLAPGFASLLHKCVTTATILAATVLVARIATGLVKLYTRGVEGVVPSTSIFLSLTRIIVMVLGGLIALQSVGISIAPILTALGVGGLATALALQPTLSNLFSGIQILASRAIKPGDFIRLGTGEEGYVHDISWRIATIRTTANNLILVPNAKLADAVVTNFHATDAQLALVVPLTVAYDSDMGKVERVTLEIASGVQAVVQGGVPDHEPIFRLAGLGDSAIQIQVVLRVKEWGDQALVRHEFLRRILVAYAQEGIEIPFPQRVVRNAI